MRFTGSIFTAVVLDLAVLLALAFLCACESDSASQTIEVYPDSATLYYGESVSLTAYNGYTYTWSLENSAWGTLSSRSGSTVTYKSLYEPTAVAVQIITVTSAFSDNCSGGSSNPVTHTAYAHITHLPTPTNDTGAATE